MDHDSTSTTYYNNCSSTFYEYITITVYLHKTIYPSSCYVMITVDHGSSSTVFLEMVLSEQEWTRVNVYLLTCDHASSSVSNENSCCGRALWVSLVVGGTWFCWTCASMCSAQFCQKWTGLQAGRTCLRQTSRIFRLLIKISSILLWKWLGRKGWNMK